MKKILVASTNPGKIAEIGAMLDLPAELAGLKDFPRIREIEEDGETFEENSRKKALGYSKATGLWTLADDSGLVIDALGGQPGVKSARFAGVSGDRKTIDRKNIEKVLKLLKDVPEEKRTARFICSLTMADADKILAQTHGVLEGIIIDTPAGENGFGYDPVFYVPEKGKTIAQMESDEKNLISHRGQAIRKLKPLIEQLLKNL